MSFARRVWPHSEIRRGDPDSFESGYGLHPSLVKMCLINGGVPTGPGPRTRLDLKIGWHRLREVLGMR